MAAKSLRDLLVVKLQALYDIESELIKALPEMAQQAEDEELKKGFEEHLRETQEQAKRLERAFGHLEEEPKKLEVAGIRGIVQDAKWLMANIEGEDLMDAGLISSALYVEHYEMAGYQSAIEWADLLGETEVASLLEENLEEEETTAEKLGLMASSINAEADETDSLESELESD